MGVGINQGFSRFTVLLTKIGIKNWKGDER